MLEAAIGEGDRREAIIRLSFARFDIRALAIATGLVTGGVLWFATAALLVKGAAPGTQPGAHLSQLASLLPGYAVSWPGSLVGLVYGFLLGFVVGGSLAFGWNLSHFVVLMRARGRYGHGGDL